MIITIEDYFGPWEDHPDATEERKQNARLLLHACSALQYFAERDGVEFLDNPHTGNNVSGKTYGGFRPQDCPQGAPASSHKQGQGVDRYDPEGLIDAWCMNNSEVGGLLETCGIYIEAPGSTPGWSHWTTRRPPSGIRVFRP